MGSTNVTNGLAWPSQNDANGGVTGDGKTWLELKHRLLSLSQRSENYVVSGGLLVTSGTLVLAVPQGEAYIDGRYVSWSATNVTLPASNTSHIFVKLVKSASLVQGGGGGIQIEDNLTGTPPSDSVKLGTATTSGSAVTSVTDQRLLSRGKVIPRIVSFTASGTWRCPEGITEVGYFVQGAGGGGGGGGGGGDASGASNGEAGTPGSHGLPGTIKFGVAGTTPGTNYTITVGAGGSGGAGGAHGIPGSNGSNGTDGGTSSFGALASATGGRRGIAGQGGIGAVNATVNVTGIGLSTTNGDDKGQPGLGGGAGNGNDSAGPGTDGVAGGNGADGIVVLFY